MTDSPRGSKDARNGARPSNDTLRPTPRTEIDAKRWLDLDFPGLEIGVAEYAEGPTGCTVFAFGGVSGSCAPCACCGPNGALVPSVIVPASSVSSALTVATEPRGGTFAISLMALVLRSMAYTVPSLT